MAILAVRQHHPGQEGSEGRGQSHSGHQQRYADNQGKGRGNENFSDMGSGNGAKNGPAAVFTKHIDESDGKQHHDKAQIGRKRGDVKQGAAVVGVAVHHSCRQQWHDG